MPSPPTQSESESLGCTPDHPSAVIIGKNCNFVLTAFSSPAPVGGSKDTWVSNVHALARAAPLSRE